MLWGAVFYLCVCRSCLLSIWRMLYSLAKRSGDSVHVDSDQLNWQEFNHSSYHMFSICKKNCRTWLLIDLMLKFFLFFFYLCRSKGLSTWLQSSLEAQVSIWKFLLNFVIVEFYKFKLHVKQISLFEANFHTKEMVE